MRTIEKTKTNGRTDPLVAHRNALTNINLHSFGSSPRENRRKWISKGNRRLWKSEVFILGTIEKKKRKKKLEEKKQRKRQTKNAKRGEQKIASNMERGKSNEQ